MIKSCPVCNKEFETNDKKKKYCSPECQKKYNKTQYYQDIKFTKKPNVKCDYCGKEFYKIPSSIKKSNFCCRQHQNIYLAQKRKIKTSNVVCDNCSKKFYKKPSNITNLNFCSLKCKQEYLSKHHSVQLKCSFCGKEYIINKYRYENNKSRFCSKQCMDNWQRRYYLYTHCYTCGKEIVVDRTRQRNRKVPFYFCSVKCANKYLLSKENNPNYKGITDITKALRHYYEQNQRKLIFKRDNKTCVICGSVGEEVHHIYPLFKIIEDYIDEHPEFDINNRIDREKIIKNIINDPNNKFNDLNNLICVCKKCHDEIFHPSGWMENIDKIILDINSELSKTNRQSATKHVD